MLQGVIGTDRYFGLAADVDARVYTEKRERERGREMVVMLVLMVMTEVCQGNRILDPHQI